jgi:hypothetical protein
MVAGLPSKKAYLKSSIFWDICLRGIVLNYLSTGTNISCLTRSSRALLATYFTLVSCLVYSSVLKMEATYSSEKSFVFQHTKQRYISEGRTLYNQRCENFKSCKNIKIGFSHGPNCTTGSQQTTLTKMPSKIRL